MFCWGQAYFPVPKTPSERVRPLRPSIGGMVDTASTSFSLMCRFHTFFRRHARRATAGSENPARAMEASLALVRRALMEDLRDALYDQPKAGAD